MGAKRILIVEDEILIAEDLKIKIEHMGHVVVDVCDEYPDIIRSITSYKPDLVLLDINLSGPKSGIDVARELDESFGIPFIFVTSHTDSRTLDEAKKTRPKGYLVKPFSLASLISTLEITFYAIDAQKVEPAYDNQCLIAKDGNTTFKVPYQKIKWIQSDKQYMEIYADDKVRIVRMTMEDLIDTLPKNLFCRIHRSFIVNIDRIKEIKGGVVLVENENIPVGRKYKDEIQKILNYGK